MLSGVGWEASDCGGEETVPGGVDGGEVGASTCSSLKSEAGAPFDDAPEGRFGVRNGRNWKTLSPRFMTSDVASGSVGEGASAGTEDAAALTSWPSVGAGNSASGAAGRFGCGSWTCPGSTTWDEVSCVGASAAGDSGDGAIDLVEMVSTGLT